MLTSDKDRIAWLIRRIAHMEHIRMFRPDCKFYYRVVFREIKYCEKLDKILNDS